MQNPPDKRKLAAPTGSSNAPVGEPGIDIETVFKKVGFLPHSEPQWDYCRSGLTTSTRFNIPCCGRRWGKSIASGHKFTVKSMKEDAYCWVVGPTYKLGEKEFRIVYRDYERLGLLKYCKKGYSVNQGNMYIVTPWNARIEVVSAEKPDSLLGEGLWHVCMSEAAKHQRSTWEQYIEPALSDFRGSADFPSTPKGFNWYHGLFLLGQDAGFPDYQSWTFPTWTNPVRYPGGYNDPELIRIRSVASTQYWEQEYGALFTSFAGAIYDEWREDIHVIGDWQFRKDWQNFMAFDFGYANPFVALDIQVSPSDDVFVWREYYSRYQSTYDHGIHLRNRTNPEGYHIDGMWGDPRGADEIATLGPLLGFVAAQDVPWKLGVEAIKRLLKQDANTGTPKLFISQNCPNLIRQMSQLHVKEASRTQKFDLNEHAGDGNVQHKVDDHAADALRYFVGPYYVLGAGTHLEDVYGNQYAGSESDSFFRLYAGQAEDNNISLDEAFLL